MITDVKLDAEHTLSFVAQVDGRTLTATYPRGFVEDEIGEYASRQDCKDYLDVRAAIVIEALRARIKGEYGSPPFNAVRIK